MNFYHSILVLFGLFTLQSVNSSYEKIASHVLTDGTTDHVFLTADRTDVLMWRATLMSKNSNFTGGNRYFVLDTYLPKWANLSSTVDTTPDVNIMGDRLISVYFTAMDKTTQKTAIGVAVSDTMADSAFITLSQPLLRSSGREDLSNPYLRTIDGNLYLFYHNSTGIKGSTGGVMRVQLSEDGLQVAGQQVNCWDSICV